MTIYVLNRTIECDPNTDLKDYHDLHSDNSGVPFTCEQTFCTPYYL